MTDILQKILAIALSVSILAQTVAVRLVVGTWLFPACIFGLFWFAFTFLPLIALFNVPINPASIAFILLSTLIFSAAGLAFDWKTHFAAQRSRPAAPELYSNRFLRYICYAVIAVAMICIGLNSQLQGFTVDDIQSDLVGSSSRYASMRSSGELRANLFGQSSLLLTYLAAAVGGLIVPTVRRTSWRLALVSAALLPSVTIMLTQSAKGALFLSLAFFYGGVLVSRINAGRFALLSRRAMGYVAAYGVILTFLVGVSFLARGLYGSAEYSSPGAVFGRLALYFKSYLFAHIYAFSDWFGHELGLRSDVMYELDERTYGFYTFTPILKILGSERIMPPGVFIEDYAYGDIGTNIYTVYRQIITDFGIAGCCLFTVFSSYLCHLAYRNLLNHRKPHFSAAGFICMIGYFAHSYLGSVLMYNSFYGTFVIVSGVLFVNSLKLHGASPSRARILHSRTRLAR